MAVINVGNGPLARTLIDALNMASPGDVLIVDEGTYDVGGVWVDGLHIQGRGQLSNIVIRGQLTVKNRCIFENITVEAQSKLNAINVSQPNSQLTARNIFAKAFGDETYPALYIEGNVSVRLEQSTILSNTDNNNAIDVTQKALFEAHQCLLGRVFISDSKAILDTVSCTVIKGSKHADIQGNNIIEINPPEGSRSIVLSGGTQCVINQLGIGDIAQEAYCEDSRLHISNVSMGDNSRFLIYRSGASDISASGKDVLYYDKDGELPAPVIEWPLEHAHEFQAKVLKNMLPIGSTVLLDPGDYYFDDYDKSAPAFTNLRFVGKDPKNLPVIHGSFNVLSGATLHLENVIVKPAEERAALHVSGSTVTAKNVDFYCDPSEKYFVISASDNSNVTLEACVVHGSGEDVMGAVEVSSASHMVAKHSSVPWMYVQGNSQFIFENFVTCFLSVVEGSTAKGLESSVTPADGSSIFALNILRNNCNQRCLVVKEKSTLELPTLGVDLSDVAESYVSDSQLTIGRHSALENGRDEYQHEILFENDGVVTVEEGENFIITELKPEPAPQTTAPSSAETEEPVATEEATELTPEQKQEKVESLLAELDNMIGLAPVKTFVRKLVNRARVQKQGAQFLNPGERPNYHMVFTGNPGTGKTTVARIIAQIFYNLDILQNSNVTTTERSKLIGSYIGHTEERTTEVINSAMGGVLFVDEAYQLYVKESANDFGKQAIETFITRLEDDRDKFIAIFAGYTNDMEEFMQANEGLDSRIPLRIEFPDYEPEEVGEIAALALAGRGWEFEKEKLQDLAARVYQKLPAEKKSNGRWARNFVERIEEEHYEYLATNNIVGPEMKQIADETLAKFEPADTAEENNKEAKVQELLAELDGLIGLQPVKEFVRKLVNRARLAKEHPEFMGDKRPNYHMEFTGNPGTGKTTVANLIAQIFYNLDFLEKPTVTTTERSSLIGSYIGHTEKQTSEIIDASLGGVLFVDEAYQLYVKDSANDFGKQAIETFITRLENDRDKFIAIFAGYTKDMQEFMQANEGLRSRIPHTIEFPDYTPEEIGKIVVITLRNKKRTFDEQALETFATRVYASLSESERASGNGRWARNFVDKIDEEHVEYIISNPEGVEDISYIPVEVFTKLAPEHSMGLLWNSGETKNPDQPQYGAVEDIDGGLS